MGTSSPGSQHCHHPSRSSRLTTTNSLLSPLNVSKVGVASVSIYREKKKPTNNIYFPSLGLMNLLKLELEENMLHEGSVSPLAFKPLRKLQTLQLDNNRFRSIPPGLPPSLQVLCYDSTEILWGKSSSLKCLHQLQEA